MLTELLDLVGVDLGVSAMLVIIAWNLFRGARAGKRAGSVLGRAITYVVIVLASFGLAAMLSWADLHVAAALADVTRWAGWLWSAVESYLGDQASLLAQG